MYVPLKTLKVWLRLAEKVGANKFLLNWKGYFWCLPFCRETLNICKFQSVKQTSRMLVESCPLNFWRHGNWGLIIDMGRSNKKKKKILILISTSCYHTCPSVYPPIACRPAPFSDTYYINPVWYCILQWY